MLDALNVSSFFNVYNLFSLIYSYYSEIRDKNKKIKKRILKRKTQEININNGDSKIYDRYVNR